MKTGCCCLWHNSDISFVLRKSVIGLITGIVAPSFFVHYYNRILYIYKPIYEISKNNTLHLSHQKKKTRVLTAHCLLSSHVQINLFVFFVYLIWKIRLTNQFIFLSFYKNNPHKQCHHHSQGLLSFQKFNTLFDYAFICAATSAAKSSFFFSILYL